jgi:hypothetical protein
MGLENAQRAMYLTVADGKVVRRVKEPTATSKERTNKQGTKVNEEHYDQLTGVIVDIKTQVHPQYGKFWNVFVQDKDQTYILQFNYSSGYSSAFLKLLPNVDLTAPVKIVPTMKIENDKKKVGVFIIQHGKPLKHFYTKETPNGLPQMVQKTFKGQKVWDDTDMMEFLENMVKTEILPHLKGVTTEVAAQATTQAVAETAEAGAADDEVPF